MGPAPSKEILLTFGEDRETKVELIGRRMFPVRGYAKRVLSSLIRNFGRSNCLSLDVQYDLSNYAAAFSLIMASNMYDYIHPHSQDGRMHIKNFVASTLNVVLEVARVVLDDYFDLPHIRDIEKDALHQGMHKLPPPSSLLSMDDHRLPDLEWKRIKRSVFDLAQLILAFSSVGQPEICEGMLINDALMYDSFGFDVKMSEKGKGFEVDKNIWYHTLGFLMQSRHFESPDDQARRECEFTRRCCSCRPAFHLETAEALADAVCVSIMSVLMLWLDNLQGHIGER